MGRAHLIEIHEQSWCPPAVRDGATDFLRFFGATFHPYAAVAERLLAAVCSSSPAGRVVDLCSGSGGPWPRLLEGLAADQRPRVVLTDFFPNTRVEEQENERLSYRLEPVDARAVPADLPGFRTLFASFHHFRPDDAAAILRDAVEQGEGIAICELGARKLSNMAGVLLLTLLHLLSVPWQRPFRGSRLLWTYLLPAIPLVLCFDGLVSCLRTYSPAELEQMVASIPSAGYGWQVGEEKMGWLPLRVTYLIGTPE